MRTDRQFLRIPFRSELVAVAPKPNKSMTGVQRGVAAMDARCLVVVSQY
jgi:hypothetical protein